jgi:hypothetical protein
MMCQKKKKYDLPKRKKKYDLSKSQKYMFCQKNKKYDLFKKKVLYFFNLGDFTEHSVEFKKCLVGWLGVGVCVWVCVCGCVGVWVCGCVCVCVCMCVCGESSISGVHVLAVVSIFASLSPVGGSSKKGDRQEDKEKSNHEPSNATACRSICG